MDTYPKILGVVERSTETSLIKPLSIAAQSKCDAVGKNAKKYEVFECPGV